MQKKNENKHAPKRAAKTAESFQSKGDEPFLQTLLQFLKEIKVGHDEPELWTDERKCERFRIRTGVPLDSGFFGVLIIGNISHRSMQVYTVSPTSVPRKARVRCAEFLTRANYGLLHGNLEMDFEDGEVRYKMSMEFDGVPMSFVLLRYLLYMGWSNVNLYQAALEEVVIGERTPAEADAEVRRKEEEGI